MKPPHGSKRSSVFSDGVLCNIARDPLETIKEQNCIAGRSGIFTRGRKGTACSHLMNSDLGRGEFEAVEKEIK